MTSKLWIKKSIQILHPIKYTAEQGNNISIVYGLLKHMPVGELSYGQAVLDSYCQIFFTLYLNSPEIKFITKTGLFRVRIIICQSHGDFVNLHQEWRRDHFNWNCE